MSAENLLQRLDKVKKTGRDKWKACCPAHADKNPSLSVRETDGGQVMIHCFSGCAAIEVLDAVGLNWADLYPPKITGEFIPKVRKPWSAGDALMGLAYESLLLLQYAKQLSNGLALSSADHQRLLLTTVRIQRAREIAQ